VLFAEAVKAITFVQGCSANKKVWEPGTAIRAFGQCPVGRSRWVKNGWESLIIKWAILHSKGYSSFVCSILYIKYRIWAVSKTKWIWNCVLE